MSRLAIAFTLLGSFVFAQEAKKEEPQQATARIAEIEIKIDGTEDPMPPNPFGQQAANYHGFLKLIEKAAHDPKIDGVILKPKSYGIGWARLMEVREALTRLRGSGKKVFVYMESMSTADLVLASVADRISVPESGSVFLPGVAIESLYMREMLSKLRLKFDVIHIGEYKTAGESLVRDTMSKELKESLDPILDEFYASMVTSIARGRGVSEDVVKKAIDAGILNAKAAKAAGLIDRVEYYDQFKNGVKAFFPDKRVKRAGDYKKKKLAFDPANPFAVISEIMQALMGGQEKRPEGPKVAVVYCSGPIVSGKTQYDWSGNISAMGSETIVKAIDRAAKEKDVKAIVLRVNSPGGSGLASDMIWRAVARAKERKPVIASMGDVAASGGYYISMNSNVIMADPETITGSIGVVGLIPNVDDFWAWVGITPQRLTRGKRAAALMTSKALSDDDKRVFREYMKEFYGDFVAKVAAGRGKTPAEIEPIARGRIWSGRDALRNGLVDRLGGLEDAIALARQRGGIKAGAEFHVMEYPRRKGPFEFFEEMFGVRLGLDDLALAKMPEVRKVLSRLAVLRRMARDRICVVAPELADLASVGR